MNLTNAQTQFTVLLQSVQQHSVPAFLKWIKHTSEKNLEELEETNEDKILTQICEDVRDQLPRNATLPSETINFPTVGENADCDPQTTVHVDAFLYPEEVVDELCDNEMMSRNYCKTCGSHDTAPLTFISHSISRTQLKYVFQHMLPDLRGLTVVDVGSRIGAVLYGAYHYSAASSIIGVEMNADLCSLQDKVVEKYQLQDRVKVICADICTQVEVLQAADVVVLHNVFEFFMPVDVQEKIWASLRQCLQRSGALLVMSPSLEQSTQHLQVSLAGWVEQVPAEEALGRANLLLFGDQASEDSDLGNIFLYKVL